MEEQESSSIDASAIRELADAYQTIKTEVSKVIVGQQDVVEQLLIAIFSQGHCLLEGVPGLAKTLMVSTLAKTLDLSFSRIQFTPDLMPADITGTEIIEENRSTGQREYRFIEGPVFANVLLADEINRTPPKTQASLLEAMQERQVTIGRTRHGLPEPFFVLATQNPIDQEGTYPLPEAQQDRFMFKVFVNYPSFDDELEVARRTTRKATAEVSRVLTLSKILNFQAMAREVLVSDHVIRYALTLVRQTRIRQAGATESIRQKVSWGAGPRAVQFLVLGGKTRAILNGRTHVTTEDIRELALPVLRHRIMVSFGAAADGITADDVIQEIVQTTPDKESELSSDERLQGIFAS